MRKTIIPLMICCLGLAAEAAPRKLSWAPPVLTNPVVKSIGPARSSIKLDVTKDYILKLPEDEPYIGELNIYGGHNVVLIGGEVKIPTEEEGYTASKRSVYLHGQTGTIHVEGLHITGAGLHEGADFYARLFLLNHPDARLEALTVSEGRTATGNGGNVYIGTAGGTLENCILEKGDATKSWGSSGGNLFMRVGQVNRCIIRNGKAKEGTGQWYYGGGVAMGGGVLANSLIIANTCAKGASVWMKSSAKMVNCTIAGNTGKNVAGVHAESNCRVVNCAIFGNVSSGDATGTKYVWDNTAAAFDHCAAEIAINENCFAIADPAFAAAAQGDYALTRTSPLVDAGVKDDAAGTTDLAGKMRRSGTATDIGCDEYLWKGLIMNVQ